MGNANAQVPNLLAQQKLWGGSIQLPLPSDQWKLEVDDFHGNVLAMLQRSIVDYATGPPNREWDKFIDLPQPGTPEARLCGMIRVRSKGDYANISVLGMGIIVFASLLIVLLNIFLPTMARLLQGKSYGGRTRTEAWEADDLYKVY